MIVDMGDVEIDAVVKEEVEKGGRVDTAAERKKGFPLSQTIKMEELRHSR